MSDGETNLQPLQQAPHNQSPFQLECQHANTTTDPESGRRFCSSCGLEIPDRPVTVGGRQIPPHEWLRRSGQRLRKIDEIQLTVDGIRSELERMRHQGYSAVARVRGIKCAWPACDAPPKPGSKWCPAHKQERIRESAKERQRRKRARSRVLKVTPVLSVTRVTRDAPI
jgi:hypothetical protein